MNQILPSALNPTGAPAQDAAKLAMGRAAIIDTIEWLTRLSSNKDFIRYIAFVEKGADSCLASGSNIDTRDAVTRDAYMQRFAGLNAMRNWPAKQLKEAQVALKELDEKQRSAV